MASEQLYYVVEKYHLENRATVHNACLCLDKPLVSHFSTVANTLHPCISVCSKSKSIAEIVKLLVQQDNSPVSKKNKEINFKNHSVFKKKRMIRKATKPE